MDPAGFIFMVIGAASAIWPYRLAKFGEILDAVGSKRSLGEVEPADWNVGLTRLVGIVMVIVGSGMVLFG